MARTTKEQREARALVANTKETGGNNKPDRAWLEAVAGELLEPDEAGRPDGFLYDVNYQWNGYADEVDPEFFEYYRRFKNSPNCTAQSYIRDHTGMYVIDLDWERLRRPCLMPPARGTTVCYSHGAKIPAVVAAAKQRLAEASEVVAIRLLTLTGVKDEDNMRIRPQDRIAAINSALDRVGIKTGIEVEITGTGFEQVLGDLFGGGSDDTNP